MAFTPDLAAALAGWHQAFTAMRAKGAVLLADVGRRLARDWLTGSEPPANALLNSEAATATSAAATPPEEAVPVSAKKSPPRGFFLWRELSRQRRQMTSVLGGSSIQAIALSSKRLKLSDGVSPRRRLAEFTRALPGARDADRVGRAFESAPALLLFDPERTSSLREWTEECARERVFIIDYAFIAQGFLRSPLRLPWRWLRLLRRLRGRLSLRAAAVTALFTVAYEDILAPPAAIEGWFLTSNSMASEILRMVLLHSPRCARVCELTHGVPSAEFEEYLQAVRMLTPDPARHAFVPQITGLPVQGVLAAAIRAEPEYAVNCSINRYFINRPARELVAWLAQESRRQGLAGPGARIVCLMGATAHDPDYGASEAYAIEHALLRHVSAWLREHQVDDCILCYAPHPAHPRAIFADLEQCVGARVLVWPDTVSMWLAADLCLALYSSALFEARFAGARVYTPLRAADGVYPQTLLDTLGHTGADGAREGLSQALAAMCGSPPVDLATKVELRLRRFTDPGAVGS